MFALGSTLFITALAVARLRWAAVMFAFMLPFSPRTLSLSVGQAGFALTPHRLWVIVLFSGLLLAIFHGSYARLRIRALLAEQKIFVRTLSALILVKLTSTLLFSETTALFYVFDDLLFSAGVFTVFFVVTKTKTQFRKLMFAVILGVVVSGFLTLVERQKSAPLLSEIANTQVTGVEKSIEGRERNNNYRVQAFFDNPLLLAEFVALAAPFAILFVQTSHGRQIGIALAAVIFAYYIIWNTGSRSGMLAGAVGLVIFRLSITWSRSTRITKIALTFVVMGLFIWAAWSSVQLIISLGMSADTDKLYQYEASERSALERASQYIIVVREVSHSPLFGFGVQQNYENQFDSLNNLDNYWLRLVLEGGLLALILFFSLLLTAASGVLKLLGRASSRYDQLLYSAMLSFLGSFALMKFFLSMPNNNIYFYMIYGAFCASHLPRTGQKCASS